MLVIPQSVTASWTPSVEYVENAARSPRPPHSFLSHTNAQGSAQTPSPTSLSQSVSPSVRPSVRQIFPKSRAFHFNILGFFFSFILNKFVKPQLGHGQIRSSRSRIQYEHLQEENLSQRYNLFLHFLGF